MPFTFSHPAAVLPLSFINKKWISVTALIIGSITPDFEYFLRMQQDSYYSHTWSGIFWFDLPMGLLALYLFNQLIRKDLIENLPDFLNRRFSDARHFKRNLDRISDFLFVIISLFVGILSHLVWDRLTHKSINFIEQQEHYNVFWEANSLAGFIVIAAMIWKMRLGSKIKKDNILPYWLSVSIITAAVIYPRLSSPAGVRELGISAIVGFFAGLTVTSLVLKIRQRFMRSNKALAKNTSLSKEIN